MRRRVKPSPLESVLQELARDIPDDGVLTSDLINIYLHRYPGYTTEILEFAGQWVLRGSVDEGDGEEYATGMTLEDVFIRKLKEDPGHVLELVRDYLESPNTGDGYTRKLIHKHVMPWMEKNTKNEDLARRTLGEGLMNMLRPI